MWSACNISDCGIVRPRSFRGLDVDDQLEFRRLFDGQPGGLDAGENLVHVNSRTAKHVLEIRPIRHEQDQLGRECG